MLLIHLFSWGKEIVHNILSNAYNHLNKNGELWVVIQKKQGAPSVEVFDHVEKLSEKTKDITF